MVWFGLDASLIILVWFGLGAGGVVIWFGLGLVWMSNYSQVYVHMTWSFLFQLFVSSSSCASYKQFMPFFFMCFRIYVV